MIASDNAPIKMRGAGYYSEHTQGAKLVIDAAIPLVLAAVEEMDLSTSSPFGVADYGAADGGTSLALHHALIAALRARTGRAITVTHTDLPHNDFSALFRLLHGLLPGKLGLGLEAPNLFSFASGTSFFRQIVPDGTLNLGFSATAMHWLSKLPATLTDHVHAVGAKGAALAAFAAHAAADWETILLARARELAPGGRLVFANFCTDESGYYLGWTGAQNMHATFAKHWLGLRATGVITVDEVRRATFPQFYRSLQEFRGPFDDPDSAASRAGLRLEDCFTRVTKCPYEAAFTAGQPPSEFARAYVPTLRSWSESMFFGALDPARPEDERRTIVDSFYDAYEADVAAAPEGHGMDYVHCFLTIAKTA
jgi:hypothetical protein